MIDAEESSIGCGLLGKNGWAYRLGVRIVGHRILHGGMGDMGKLGTDVEISQRLEAYGRPRKA